MAELSFDEIMGVAPRNQPEADFDAIASGRELNLPQAAEPQFAPVSAPAIERGINRTAGGLVALGHSLGMVDDATLTNTIMNQQAYEKFNPAPKEYEEARQRAREEGIFGYSNIKQYVEQPGLLLTDLGEQLPGVLAGSAGGVLGAGIGAGAGALATAWSGPGAAAGAATGATVGAIAGGGLSSAALEYGPAFNEYLKEELGVKELSPAIIQYALGNEDLVRDVSRKAAVKAGIIGAFDAIGMGYGAKIAAKAFKPGATIRDKLVGTAKGVGVDTAAATVGEATAQGVVDQKINWYDVGQEGLGELMGSGPIEVIGVGKLLSQAKENKRREAANAANAARRAERATQDAALQDETAAAMESDLAGYDAVFQSLRMELDPAAWLAQRKAIYQQTRGMMQAGREAQLEQAEAESPTIPFEALTEEEAEKQLNDKGRKTRNKNGTLNVNGKKAIQKLVETENKKRQTAARNAAPEQWAFMQTEQGRRNVANREGTTVQSEAQQRQTAKFEKALRDAKQAMRQQMGMEDPDEAVRRANEKTIAPALEQSEQELQQLLRERRIRRQDQNIPGSRGASKRTIDTTPNIVEIPSRGQPAVDLPAGPPLVDPTSPESIARQEEAVRRAREVDARESGDESGESRPPLAPSAPTEEGTFSGFEEFPSEDFDPSQGDSLIPAATDAASRWRESWNAWRERMRAAVDENLTPEERIARQDALFVDGERLAEDVQRILNSLNQIPTDEIAPADTTTVADQAETELLANELRKEFGLPEEKSRWTVESITEEARRRDRWNRATPLERQKMLDDAIKNARRLEAAEARRANVTGKVQQARTSDAEEVQASGVDPNSQESIARQEEAVRQARKTDAQERRQTKPYRTDNFSSETEAAEYRRTLEAWRDGPQIGIPPLTSPQEERGSFSYPPIPRINPPVEKVRVEVVGDNIVVTQSGDPNQRHNVNDTYIDENIPNVGVDLAMAMVSRNEIPTQTELTAAEVLEIYRALENLPPKSYKLGSLWKEFIGQTVEWTDAVENVFRPPLDFGENILLSAESLVEYINFMSVDMKVTLTDPLDYNRLPVTTEDTLNEVKDNNEIVQDGDGTSPAQVLTAVKPILQTELPKTVTPQQISFATLNFPEGINARIDIEAIEDVPETYTFRSAVDSEGSLVMIVTNSPDIFAREVRESRGYDIRDQLIRWATQNGYQYIVFPQALTDAVGSSRQPGYLSLVPDSKTVDVLLQDEKTGEATPARGYILGSESKYVRGRFDKDALPKRPTFKMDIGLMDKASMKARGITASGLKKMSDAVFKTLQRFGITVPVSVTITTKMRIGSASLGEVLYTSGGGYDIIIHPTKNWNAARFFATLMHEVGHVIVREKISNAPLHIRQAIHDDFQKVMHNFITNRRFNNAREYIATMLTFSPIDKEYTATEYNDYAAYFTTRKEFLAESISRWALTKETPRTFLQRFYKKLGNILKSAFADNQAVFGSPNTELGATPNLDAFLDSFVATPDINSEIAFTEQLEADIIERNDRALSLDGHTAEIGAVAGNNLLDPRDTWAGTVGISSATRTIVNSTSAVADRFNKLHRNFLGVHQVAMNNLHMRQPSNFVQLLQQGDLYRKQILERAVETQKMWDQLSPSQNEGLVKLIDDYVQMTYLTADEKQRKVVRKPTQQELNSLARKHKLNRESVGVFARLSDDFTFMLAEMEKQAVVAASKLTDQTRRAEKMKAIQTQYANLRKIPYFPLMRFGKYTVTVYDKKGPVQGPNRRKVLEFYMAETKKEANALHKQMEKKYAGTADTWVQSGETPEDVYPLAGMPPAMLDLVGNKLKLSTTQRNALEQLKYALAAGDSFRKRMMRRKLTKGYSNDFKRSYEKYMFHGSMFLGRLSVVDQLRHQIKSLRASKHDYPDSSIRENLANFLAETLDLWSNPRTDGRMMKALMFVVHLGFNAASALLNWSQLITTTAPYLGAKFGTAKSTSAILRASKSIETYYKKINLTPPQPGQGLSQDASRQMLQALGKAMEWGVIDENMSAELAGYSQGSSLMRRWGFDEVSQNWNQFVQASGFLFRMIEQMVRRVTFRAAFTLAMQNPTNPAIADAVKNTQNLFYKQLRDEGWTEKDAAAAVFAKQTVEETQFMYSGVFQPRFMTGGVKYRQLKGPLQTLFIFKTFLQSTVYFAFSKRNRDSRLRYFLTIAAIGGLMGLPGAEDMEELLDALGKMMIGGHFSTKIEARKLITNLSNGTISPDLLLHGTSKYGYGMQVVKDLTGFPIPVVDRSRAQSVGKINPIPYGMLLNPQGKPEEDVYRAVESMTGPAGGYALGVWRAMNDMKNPVTDPKRWERVVPKFASNLSKAWRAYDEGLERSPSGTTMATFDPNNWQDMNEIIAMGLGYNPLKLSARWDYEAAKNDVLAYWDMRRRGLLARLNTAYRGGDQEEIKAMLQEVQDFTNELPPAFKGYAIKPSSVRQSIKMNTERRIRQEMSVGRTDREYQPSQDLQKLFPSAPIDVRKVK